MLEYSYQPTTVLLDIPQENKTFKGCRRKNGEVGTRNEIWIIPTVGCVNGVVSRLADLLQRETGGKGIDGIRAFPHNYGCSQLGEDHENTKKILRNTTLHPNAGGVLVVGLGCENNQPDDFRKYLGAYDNERIRFLITQNVDDELEEGMRILREIYARCKEDVRTDNPSVGTSDRTEMRRFRRFFRHHGKPAFGTVFRLPDSSRRNNGINRSSGDVWCGNDIDEPMS